MLSRIDAVSILAGVTQTEKAQASAPTNIHMITGTVSETSEDGRSLILIDGLAYNADNTQTIEVDTLGGLEEGDTATILLTGESGHAMTPIAIGSVGSIDRIVTRINVIEADYVKAETIEASVAFIAALEAGEITAAQVEAAAAYIGQLTANSITAASLQTDVAKIHNLTAESLSASTAYISDLTAGNLSASDILTDHAEIGSLDTNYAHISNGVIDNAKIGHADVNGLSANYAHVSSGVIDNATIGHADVNGLNANYAHVSNGVIDNAAVGDAQILGVSANKLTAGTIDASNINVSNLRADTLIVNKLNGQPVFGGYIAVDSNGSGYSSKNPAQQGWYEISNGQMVLSQDTEVDDSKAYYSTSQSVSLYDQSYIDGIESALNSRIDGAIETFSGSVVPTKQNYPYTEWYDTTTVPVTDNRAEHVGDLYYVLNENLDEDGWCYRFYYDNTTHDYDWVLIKDSDVTSALGRISDLETFETNTSNWIEETDDGLETIRTNHTSLSGTVDKTVKESVQLWFTKANTTAPSKPTSQVTNNSQTGSNSYNKWNLAVPVYNASYPYYFFCWQFKLVDGTYAWSDVVYDQATSEAEERGRTGVSLANANIKSSVQLWFSKANTTKPDKPTSQITSDSTSGNAWRLVVPTYSSSYPYYYYCYQQQKGDGTYQWTDVVYDEATSTSMKKAQAALPSSTFTTFETTTFKDVKDTVDEHSATFTTYSEMTATDTSGNTVTGLTNIVNSVNSSANSNSSSITSLQQVNTANGLTSSTNISNRASLIEQDLSGYKITVINTYATKTSLSAEEAMRKAHYATCATAAATAAKVATLSPSVTGFSLYAGCIVTVRFQYGNSVEKPTLNVNSTGAKKIVVNATENPIADHVKWGSYATCTFVYDGAYWRFTGSDQEVVALRTAETRITQTENDITLRATKTEAYQLSQPNLSPFFSMDTDDVYNATSNPNGYWNESKSSGQGTNTCQNVGDGWTHFEHNNTTSSTHWLSIYEHAAWRHANGDLKGSTKYTVMMEFRNVTKSGTVTANGVTTHTTSWPALFASYETAAASVENGAFYFIGTTVANPASLTGSYTTSRTLVSIYANSSISCDLRVSLYEGEYSGPYKPYVGVGLYASQAELKVANDAISTKVEKNGVISSINQSAETVKIQASKVEIDGTAVFNAISSDVDSAITSKGYATTTQVDALPKTYFATCSTAAATKDKVATITPAISSYTPKAGDVVNVKFSVANTFNASSTNGWVTLNVNSSGAKNIYYGASSQPTGTNTTAFGRANYTNTYIYDGTYWVWTSSSADNNSDTVNRTRWQNVIKASATITNGHIICGNSSGYRNLGIGASFDLAYPLLYAGSAIASGNTGDNNFLQINGVNLSTSGTITSGTNYTTAYLMGTVSGSTFTITDVNKAATGSGAFLTTVVPTSENGVFYIPLGMFYNSTTNIYFNSSKDLYAYLDGKFRQVTPTEIVASQKIYYRSQASGTVPKPTAWITEPGNKYNDTVSVGNSGWSTKVTPIAANKNNGATKYLYLYTCEQRKRLDGTVECTTVTLDENTTVIDGGNIITYSVTANQIAADAVTADKLAANSLTLGKFTASDKLLVDNSNVQVGGRNLLRKTGSLTTSDVNLARATVTEDGYLALTSTTSSAYASFKVHYLDFDEYGSGVYTVSLDAKLSGATSDYTTSNVLVYLGFQDPTRVDSAIMNSTNDRYTPARTLSSSLTSEWTRYETTVNVPDDMTSGKAAALSSGYMMVVELASNAKKMPILIRRVKLEKGNKATDWTPAPEDQTNYVDILAESVDETINGENGLNQRLHSAEGTIENQGITLNSTTDKANATAQALKGFTDSVSQWLTFNGSEGMTIGDTSGNYQRLDSTSQRFYSDGIEVMRTESGKVEAASMDADEMHVGEFMWVARSNGHTAFKWAKRN